MKRTYQPKKGKRLKKHGFRSKMKSKGGRKLLKRRRARGRKNLTYPTKLDAKLDKLITDISSKFGNDNLYFSTRAL